MRKRESKKTRGALNLHNPMRRTTYLFYIIPLRCVGTWVTFSAPISEEVAEDIIVMAFESGINVFDLSDGYCGPRAEVSLGRILRQRRWKRSSYVVITKIYWSYRYVFRVQYKIGAFLCFCFCFCFAWLRI